MTKVEKLRQIVTRHQCARVEGCSVDVVTASMLLAVFDDLNPTNQAKFIALPVERMVQIGWKLVG